MEPRSVPSLLNIVSLHAVSAAKSTTELEVTSAGTDVSLFVTRVCLLGASVSLAILTTLRSVRTRTGLRTGALRFGTGGALQRRRNDFRRQVQIGAQVFNALVGEIPVVVAPGELLLHEVLRFE
uniref:Uncharacterized protein n=1 Tax=Anopheles braziliensis TaxID=58242 RepID=A0A2M3ZL86_9DIPT